MSHPGVGQGSMIEERDCGRSGILIRWRQKLEIGIFGLSPPGAKYHVSFHSSTPWGETVRITASHTCSSDVVGPRFRVSHTNRTCGRVRPHTGKEKRSTFMDIVF